MVNLFKIDTRNKRRGALLSMAGATGLLLTTLCFGGFGCDNGEPPSITESFNKAQFQSAPAVQDSDHRAQLIADILAASDTVDIAVSRLEDTEVADALIAAHKRGVNVRVVSDWDSWGGGTNPDAGLQLLEDADVLPVYGDGELIYLPEPTLASILGRCQESPAQQFYMCGAGQSGDQGAMTRPGKYNLMSHNFAIIDGMTVWNFPSLVNGEQPWVGWRIESSILAYDFRSEFQQMHGGVFATTLDVYNGPIKSNTNSTVDYLTDQGRMRVLFNPQQRLVKAVIDQVYKAKSSVWLMTDSIGHPQLLKALEYKKNNGFDVRVMVHPAHQAEGDLKSRLQALGARMAPAGLDHLPTMVVIDELPDRNRDRRPRQVISVSHPLWNASPYEVETSRPNDIVKVYPSDLFVDGNMWHLSESGSTVHKDTLLDQYVAAWEEVWEK